jgi:hypothetical protein
LVGIFLTVFFLIFIGNCYKFERFLIGGFFQKNFWVHLCPIKPQSAAHNSQEKSVLPKQSIPTPNPQKTNLINYNQINNELQPMINDNV